MLRELPSVVLVVGLIPFLWSGVVAASGKAAARGAGLGGMRLEAAVLALMIAPVVMGAALLLIVPLMPTMPLAALAIPGLAEGPARPSAGPSADPWALLSLGIVALYLAGLAIAAARLLLAHTKLDRAAAAGVPCPALGGDVRLSGEAAFPFANGRGVVVLPRALAAQMSSRDLDLVVRHERAHLERRDPASFWALAWVDALFWPNPFVRWQTARCRLAAELACDAAVLAAAPDTRAAYAGALVAALKHTAVATRLAPSIVSTRSKGDHRMRLSHILSGASAPHGALARGAVAAAALLVVPVGGLQLVACAPGAGTQRSASGPVAEAPSSSGVIRTIDVEGNRTIAEETVLSLLTVAPGEGFDPVAIDASLRAMFASGLFSDVAFERRGDVLVVRVVEATG